ncbi:tyrosine-type recombinase/integrase [Microvirga subterranea]|uniref:Site-specific recombinase XerD n=1 Tax=Microvirga subterranea TaxID=186651 RepID=A0A370HU27_9HYPH|nr:site-specific integrase [Microvirga subterranea]RDI62007.1 site-specific recombinase XerD [Microvirga subterranea]
MATIRKRGSSWQAQVRREGYPPLSKSFKTKADAAAWARDKERSIDRAELPTTARGLRGVTVGDLLRRYCETVTQSKRGAEPERYRIRNLLRHGLAETGMDKLTPAAVAQYRDDRLKLVQPGTVRRELAIIQHCLEVARREWGVPITANPVQQIAIPDAQRPRERRLEDDEDNRLASAAAGSAWYLRPLISLAIETGMRRGELLSVRWKDVDMTAPTIRILKTKNGHPRTIPLTPKAVEILDSLERNDELVFPVTPNAVRLAWERLRKRAGLENLRLHDLRHEAVSRFFEYGLTVPEVALISGHRDPRMLSRYTHLRPEKVAEKLAKVLA